MQPYGSSPKETREFFAIHKARKAAWELAKDWKSYLVWLDVMLSAWLEP